MDKPRTIEEIRAEMRELEGKPGLTRLSGKGEFKATLKIMRALDIADTLIRALELAAEDVTERAFTMSGSRNFPPYTPDHFIAQVSAEQRRSAQEQGGGE